MKSLRRKSTEHARATAESDPFAGSLRSRRRELRIWVTWTVAAVIVAFFAIVQFVPTGELIWHKHYETEQELLVDGLSNVPGELAVASYTPVAGDAESIETVVDRQAFGLKSQTVWRISNWHGERRTFVGLGVGDWVFDLDQPEQRRTWLKGLALDYSFATATEQKLRRVKLAGRTGYQMSYSDRENRWAELSWIPVGHKTVVVDCRTASGASPASAARCEEIKGGLVIEDLRDE